MKSKKSVLNSTSSLMRSTRSNCRLIKSGPIEKELWKKAVTF